MSMINYQGSIPKPDATHTLNEDIYFAIFTILDEQADVSALMRSSRLLYGLGTRRLLQMGVDIRTDRELVSFCEFMRRNLPGCAQYLTELLIAIGRPRVDHDEASESDLDASDSDLLLLDGAPLLVPVIAQLSHLHNLRLEFCEELLECDARLVDAFASLTTVRTLHVASFGLRTYDIVKTIQSPLVDVHVNGEYPSLDVFLGQAATLPDPLDTLAKHHATLEKVFVCFFDVRQRIVHLSPEVKTFPRVSKLAMMDCRIRERAVLVEAFPNVRTLEITGAQRIRGRRSDDPMPDVEDVHDENRADPFCWDSLDHVYGDVDALYMLCLLCPVERLDILTDLQEESALRMDTVITDVNPERLVVHCGLDRPRWDEFNLAVTPSNLSELLLGQGDAYEDITHLGLDLGLPGISGDPLHYQSAICKLLSRLNVQFFAFRLHRVFMEYEDENPTPEAEELPVLAKFTGRFLAFWAAPLAEAAPDLEYLCFRVWDKDTYWHIARDGSGVLSRFIPLDAEAGRALMQAEGMDWRGGTEVARTLYRNGSPVTPYGSIPY